MAVGGSRISAVTESLPHEEEKPFRMSLTLRQVLKMQHDEVLVTAEAQAEQRRQRAAFVASISEARR